MKTVGKKGLECGKTFDNTNVSFKQFIGGYILNTLNCGVHNFGHVNTMVLSYLIRMPGVEVQLYCVLAKRLRRHRRRRRCQHYYC